ncbi:hypothetical protein ACFVW8_12380 [Streptomyces sp. NPDC058221]|uniref:hypothetical protein n=1 Tax=Streptomyces sp. NPDC058221 TaxID=3346388 RepID=UPI0036EEBF82
MRFARIVAIAGLTVSALSMAPFVASADDIDRGIELTPSSAKPGDSVWAATRACGDDASAEGATNASPRTSVSFKLGPAADTAALQGEFTVPSGTASGVYDVDVVCASGQKANAKLTVTVSKSQMKGVDAGVGGAHGGQSEPAYIAAGAVLIGGSGFYAAMRMRRSR